MNSQKINYLFFSILFAVLIMITIRCGREQKQLKIPEGWYQPKEYSMYDMGIDESAGVEGKKVATIRSNADADSADIGAMMEYCRADQYLGKRVRLKGFIKTKEVKRYAGFWMRITQPDSVRLQYFDDMKDRGINATSAWNEYEIVLDVPDNATSVSFGALLAGTGQMWFGRLSIDIVGSNIPVTGKYTGVYPLTVFTQSEKDTIDIRHTSKVQLEKDYRMAKFTPEEPQGYGKLPEVSNLGFDK